MLKKAFAFIIAFAILMSGSAFAAENVEFEPMSDGYISVDAENYEAAAPDEKYEQAFSLTAEQFDSLKNLICETVRSFGSSCNIYSYSIPWNQTNINILADLIYNGEPDFFNLKQQGGFSYSYSGGYIKNLVFSYAYTQETYNKMLAECEAAADKLLDGIYGNANLTQTEQALLVHDRLCVLCEFDSKNTKTQTLAQEEFNMYGALVNNICVCQGYAQSYCYCLDKLGIECYLCASTQMNHIWNIVKINGKEYHVDVTWDDKTYDMTGRVAHENFMLSSAAISKTHSGTDFDTTPTDTTYDSYFWQNSSAEFVLIKNEIYYIDNNNGTLNKWNGGTDTEVLKNIKDYWPASAGNVWASDYSKLAGDGVRLFYSLSDSIVYYDVATGKSKVVYTPDFSDYSYYSIYGFRVNNGYFEIASYNSPNFAIDTKEKNTIKYHYYLPGDCNGDQKINIKDSKTLKKYLGGAIEDDDLVTWNADVNGDGKINTKDNKALKKVLLN